MELKRAGLWQHPDFMKLWVGETISLLGSQVTNLALPLTAALILEATPEQMGILGALAFLPFPVIGLFAGVWVDRNRRKPILMAGDIGRALLLATIPVGALLHILGIEQLYVVALLVGVLTVFFDVAYQSYLPSLVGRESLVEGNSKLEISRSVAEIAGPGIAGVLVQILTAPIAIILDASSFVLSAIFLRGIQTPEPPIKKVEERHVLQDIDEGLQVVLGNRSLRSIAACTATTNLFGSIAQAVFILFATRELNLDAATIGVTFGIASIGGLLGASFNGRIVKKLGLGTTIISAIVLVGFASLLIPLASGTWIVAVVLIVVARFVGAIGNTLYNINQVSYRQVITPHHLLGRMNASMRVMIWGTIPLGSIIGGLLGSAIGLRPTLVVGALGIFIAPLWIYFSPVRQLKEPPVMQEEVENAEGV